MNTDAPWPSLEEAEQRVLGIQTKLHRWTESGHRDELVESRMRGDAHVRFGGRAEETGRPYGSHRASVRPYSWLPTQVRGLFSISILCLISTAARSSPPRRNVSTPIRQYLVFFSFNIVVGFGYD